MESDQQKTTPQITLPIKTSDQIESDAARKQRIHLIWEFTQAIIAVLITAAIIFNAIRNITSPIIDNAFFLIVSMYFVRTNGKGLTSQITSNAV